MIKELAEAGISKWDVYEEYAAECVKALSNCYDAEPVKGKKLFMLELQNLLNSTFCQQADFLMHKSGHFVKTAWRSNAWREGAKVAARGVANSRASCAAAPGASNQI